MKLNRYQFQGFRRCDVEIPLETTNFSLFSCISIIDNSQQACRQRPVASHTYKFRYRLVDNKSVARCQVQVRLKRTNEFILYVIYRNHIHLLRSTLSEEE